MALFITYPCPDLTVRHNACRWTGQIDHHPQYDHQATAPSPQFLCLQTFPFEGCSGRGEAVGEQQGCPKGIVVAQTENSQFLQ